MKRVDIKIRFKCNNLCKFCVQGDKRHQFADKSLPRVKKELSESWQNGASEVVFTGGEPTLHKDILKLLEFAR
ncbi:MAG: radical SAM protein, partial [Elusimicrobia bacterium]|nr:radical SAM protein [Elusimicrobiota bacterium]